MKKLLALMLAVLMTLSVASSAFAAHYGETDFGLTNNVYYYDTDAERLMSATNHTFAPGESIYIEAEHTGNLSTSELNRYKMFADWSQGKDLVSSLSVESRKAELVSSYQYLSAATGGTYMNFSGTIPTTLADAKSEFVDTFKSPLPAVNATDPWGVLHTQTTAADKYTISATGNTEYTALRGAGSALEAYVNAASYPPAYRVIGETAFSTANAGDAITTYLSTFPLANDTDYIAFYSTASAAGAIDTAKISGFAASTTPGNVVITGGTSAGDVTFAVAKTLLEDAINTETGVSCANTGFHANSTAAKSANMSYLNTTHPSGTTGDASLLVAIVGNKITGTTTDKYTYRAVDYTTYENALKAVANYSGTIKEVSSVKYNYFGVIKLKSNSTTKILDLIGEVGLAKTSSAFKNHATKKFLGVEVYHERATGSGSYTVSPDTGGVIKFEDDEGEVDIEFGNNSDLALFTVNASGQGALNLQYSIKYNKDISDDYPRAELEFIKFLNSPSFNRIGTMYVYADKGTYLYEELKDGTLKKVDSKWDSTYEAHVFKTRTLGSYVISDRELDIKAAPSSSAPTSSNSVSAPTGGGKPNPNTGR